MRMYKWRCMYRHMVSLCIYICIYMYVCQCPCPCTVLVSIHSVNGHRWKGPVGGSPTIPTHSPTIGYDSPTITTSGSWVEGEPVFWWKKIASQNASNLEDKNHPLTALTVDPFGNKVVEMSFFGAWSQKRRAMMAASRVATAMRWRPTSLRFFVLKKKRRLQCGDWNLIPYFFFGLILGFSWFS